MKTLIHPMYEADRDLIAEALRENAVKVAVSRPDGVQVVLGRASDATREVFAEAIENERVPLVRRRGGGCAVVLDPGNLVVSAVLPGRRPLDLVRAFERLSGWLIAGLTACGVANLHQRGISDLAVGDRKISGSAMHRAKDYLYYSATLLVCPELDRMTRYLPHPPREPDYRRGREHGEFVGTLAALSGIHDPVAFAEKLRRRLGTPDV